MNMICQLTYFHRYAQKVLHLGHTLSIHVFVYTWLSWSTFRVHIPKVYPQCALWGTFQAHLGYLICIIGTRPNHTLIIPLSCPNCAPIILLEQPCKNYKFLWHIWSTVLRAHLEHCAICVLLLALGDLLAMLQSTFHKDLVHFFRFSIIFYIFTVSELMVSSQILLMVRNE